MFRVGGSQLMRVLWVSSWKVPRVLSIRGSEASQFKALGG